jgi:hypothetical protein
VISPPNSVESSMLHQAANQTPDLFMKLQVDCLRLIDPIVI